MRARLLRHWEYVLGAVLMALWLALAFHGSSRKSPCMDEAPHFGAGMAAVRYGDFRMNPEHPPFFKMLSALPVVWIYRPPLSITYEGRELVSWSESNQWAWGHMAIFYQGVSAQKLIQAARIVPILFGALGGILAWLWGREFGGRRAGFFAMATLLFYPEYLGHARFLTLDVPTLVACAAISYTGWRWWKRPRPERAALFVLVCGIMALVKLPVVVFAVLLWGVLLAVLLVGRRQRLLLFCGLSLALFVSGYFFQWAEVGFRFTLNSPAYPMEKPSQYVMPVDPTSSHQALLTTWAHARHLLPEASLATVNHTESIEGRLVFLLGKMARKGWYSYFAVTTALKTPLVLLAGLFVAIVYTGGRLWKGRGFERERLAILLLPFLGILALIVHARLNIGHRHIMLVYFPWCVLFGSRLAAWTWRRRELRLVSGGVVAILVAVTLKSHPHQETYFNVIGGGGPYAARDYLHDSNIDWGTDLLLLGETLNEAGYRKINLAYFGCGKPEEYGISNYHFILPSYPFAIGMPAALPPDPGAPTAVSLHALDATRHLYPGLYDREPDYICNSIVIFFPEVNAPGFQPR